MLRQCSSPARLDLTLPARLGFDAESPNAKSLRLNSRRPSRLSSSSCSPIGQTLRRPSKGSMCTGNLQSLLKETDITEQFCGRLARSQDVNSTSLNKHTRVSHIVEMPNRLNHDEVQTRMRATIDLGLMGSGGGAHAPHVAEKLEDPDPAVRRRALWTLKRMTMPVLRPHLQIVADKLQHKDSEVRALAAELLGAMSYGAEPYSLEVAQCLRDSDVQVRRNAIEALGQCGKAGATPHVDAIARCLKDEDSTCRRLALTDLGKIGRPALPHAPDVISLLRDGDVSIRKAAMTTLQEMRRK